MSGMKVCECLHITPEPGRGQDLLSLIVLVLVPVPVLAPVLLSMSTPLV